MNNIMSNTGSRYMEGQLLYGNLSILQNCSNDGSIEIEGTVYTNNILEYDINSGVNIQQVSFNSGGSIIIPNSGTLYIYNTTSASSTSSGALVVNGGLGIAQDVYIGGTLDLGQGVITNVTAPSFDLDAANKWYVDEQLSLLTIGNVSGNFTHGQVLIGGTSGNINGYNNLIFDTTSGTLFVNNASIFIVDTQVATGTSGTLVTNGGISIGQNMILGDTLHVKSRDMTPSQGDLFSENIFYANNNQISPSSILGFVFNNNTKSFNASVCVSIDASILLDALYEIKGLQKSSGWIINYNFIGDYTGVNFSIDNTTGQVKYTSTFITGHNQTKIRFRALTTTV